ncbi:MAG: hypothetical protein KBH07_01870 [Flavobacteriales bacterium]|nr:hypothetical protein [Flavobacteriales bacterium]MBP9078646.1 hypothetical protein [Flavobacteriales bacterium]
MDKPVPNTITTDQLRASAMARQAFAFWFADHGHVRSPFPQYLRDELREVALAAYKRWLSQLDPKAQEEMTEEVAFSKFEELMFHEAVRLVRSEDEALTLRFPFLPRVGDRIHGGAIEGRSGDNILRKRTLVREDKDEFLLVKAEHMASGEEWETRFELP